jgi:hypothetical protein
MGVTKLVGRVSSGVQLVRGNLYLLSRMYFSLCDGTYIWVDWLTFAVCPVRFGVRGVGELEGRVSRWWLLN